MSPISDRYHVIDPALSELITTNSRRHEALDEARLSAHERGYAIEVYDTMAHRCAAHLWSVDGADWR